MDPIAHFPDGEGPWKGGKLSLVHPRGTLGGLDPVDELIVVAELVEPAGAGLAFGAPPVALARRHMGPSWGKVHNVFLMYPQDAMNAPQNKEG